MLTPEKLQAIRRRCEAATMGPWQVAGDVSDNWLFVNIVTEWREQDVYRSGKRKGQPKGEPCSIPITHSVVPPGACRLNDAHFIARARTDIPLLLLEINRLRHLLAQRDSLLGQMEPLPVEGLA